jgi:hypothetical protein
MSPGRDTIAGVFPPITVGASHALLLDFLPPHFLYTLVFLLVPPLIPLVFEKACHTHGSHSVPHAMRIAAPWWLIAKRCLLLPRFD